MPIIFSRAYDIFFDDNSRVIRDVRVRALIEAHKEEFTIHTLTEMHLNL